MNPETPNNGTEAVVVPQAPEPPMQAPMAETVVSTSPPSAPVPEKSKSNRKLFMAIGVVVILLILAAVGVFAFMQMQKPAEEDEAMMPARNASSIADAGGEDEMGDWETYRNNIFQIKHPKGFEVNEGDGDIVTLLKLGKTQKEQTELYDGISLHFDPREIEGLTLLQYAQIRVDESKNLGSTIINDLSETSLGRHQGYTYTAEGLGTHTNIFLESDSGIFLIIVDSTVDPNDEGYKKIVDQILSTFQFTN